MWSFVMKRNCYENIVRGAGRIMDFHGVYSQRFRFKYLNVPSADIAAASLASDWGKIGQDLSTAMEQYESRKQKR